MSDLRILNKALSHLRVSKKIANLNEPGKEVAAFETHIGTAKEGVFVDIDFNYSISAAKTVAVASSILEENNIDQIMDYYYYYVPLEAIEIKMVTSNGAEVSWEPIAIGGRKAVRASYEADTIRFVKYPDSEFLDDLILNLLSLKVAMLMSPEIKLSNTKKSEAELKMKYDEALDVLARKNQRERNLRAEVPQTFEEARLAGR